MCFLLVNTNNFEVEEHATVTFLICKQSEPKIIDNLLGHYLIVMSHSLFHLSKLFLNINSLQKSLRPLHFPTLGEWKVSHLHCV